MIYKALMVLALISQQLAYFFAYLKQQQGLEILSGSFYYFNAFTHFLLWFGYIYSSERDRWAKRIMFYGIVLSGNQLVDEISRKAMETQLNEIILGILIILHVAYSLGHEYGRKHRT